MFKDLRVVIDTFPKRTKVSLVAVMLAQFLASLMDLLGLGAVLPLMQVVTGGGDITGGYLGAISSLLGNPGRRTLIVYLAIIMIAAFALKTVLSLVLQWITLGIINQLNVRTSTRLLASFLHEDYLVHRQRRTADLIRAVGVSVAQALGNVLGGVMNVVSQGLSILLILGFLLIAMPGPTLVAIVYFGLAVFIMQRILSGPNRRAGAAANDANWKSSHAMHDSMTGFREIRMHDAESFFLNRYQHFMQLGADSSRKANFFAQLPKQFLELTTVGGLAALLVVIGLSSENAAAMVPSLALFVAAAIRLLPVIVSLTATLGTIAFGREGLRLTAETLQAQGVITSDDVQGATATALEPTGLEIEQISFRYPDGVHPVLKDVSLSVPRGGALAICGVSGSGKTTLVDIILGLIEPTSGRIAYGDASITELGPSWRAHVAYVPQDVFVMDAPLRANIAFGLDPAEVDEERLMDAIKRAQLSDVVDGLPQGLDTLVGERGQRLSGGQRQRIGIARALYRRPHVIVLDEATSALDNATEHKIAETIASLHGDVTTIIVAHRLSTVRNVDQLAFIEKGELAALGTFEKVRESSESFDELVRLGRLD